MTRQGSGFSLGIAKDVPASALRSAFKIASPCKTPEVARTAGQRLKRTSVRGCGYQRSLKRGPPSASKRTELYQTIFLERSDNLSD